MILTCPDCATRYFVEETRLGPQGRKVRCAACGCSWRAEGEAEALELTPIATPATVAEPPQPPRADALPQTLRAEALAKHRTRKAVAAGVVWGALAAGFVLLFALAAIFRVQVVQLWPRTAGAYAAVHMTVNPLGLTPDGVQAAPDLLAGHAALTVTGAERNVDPAPRRPAPLRVSLYDRGGHKLAERIVRLDDTSPIRPGEGRSFKVSFVDPPLAGAQVGVDFVLEAPARRPRAEPVGRAPQLRTRRIVLPVVPVAAPRTAMALPAGSPYALPLAAEPQNTRPIMSPPQPHG